MSGIWRWLFSLLRPYRGRVLFGSMLVALTVLGNTGLLATSAVLLSKAALEPEILLLMPFITGVRFFGIGRAVIRYFERLLNHSIAFRILGHLRGDFYKHLEPLVPDSYPDYTEGNLYNQFITDIHTLQFFYLRAVSVPLGSVVVYTICAIFLAQFEPRLVPLLLVGQLLAGIVIPGMAVSTGKHRKHQLSGAQRVLSEQFLDFKEGLLDLHLFHATKNVGSQLKGYAQQMTTIRYQIALKKALINRLVFLVSQCCMLAALAITITPVQNNQLEGYYVAMVALTVLASFEGIMQMPEAVVQMDESYTAAKGLHEVYQREAAVTERGNQQPTALDVHLENVRFSYHEPNRQFIEGLHMAIPFGTHLAIVGESGGGKSSVAKLITGLWHPDGGTIRLGDCRYEMLSEETLHRYIGSVDQFSYFFYASIRENMQMVNEDVSDKEIWDALAMVELDGLIAHLPGQLDTVLAENASILSGGERQRLALARLIVQDPAIVVLDEATQKLNKALAEQILQRLLKWGEKKTMILITHSLEGLEALDFIYVFSCGRIVEQGTHQVLLEQPKGYYHQLYDIEKSRV